MLKKIALGAAMAVMAIVVGVAYFGPSEQAATPVFTNAEFHQNMTSAVLTTTGPAHTTAVLHSAVYNGQSNGDGAHATNVVLRIPGDNPPNTVPAPATVALLGLGLPLMGLVIRRNRKRAQNGV